MFMLPFFAGLVCWCVLTVPATIFGGLGGFFYGALPPEESVAYPAADEVTLRYTVANYPIRITFQNTFLKEARTQKSHSFVVNPEQGPQAAEGMVGQGVDTVLELSIERIWLKRVDDRKEDLNPPMVLVLFVRVRLVGGTEKTIWYDQTFVHQSKERPYKEWPYHYNFQTDIEKAYQKLAEEIVQKLFIQNSST